MLNPTTHKKVLIRILKNIYSQPTLGPHMGFKGGTAAFMFYDLPRFSVDLDFDLLHPEKESQIFSKLVQVLPKFGTLVEATKKKYTLFFLISYQKGQRLIKIEISRRSSETKYETKSFLGTSMLVINRPDMVAGKLSALITRKKFAARDVFDLWFFLHNDWEINPAHLLQKTGLSPSAAFKKAIKIIQRTDPKHLLEGLGELVDEKQKYWIKNRLKDEVLFLLRLNGL